MHHDRGKNKSVLQTKLFLRYIDGIVRTVDGKLTTSKFTFIKESPNTSGKLAFLELQLSTDKNRRINCRWYQKPTDTGIIKKFKFLVPI